MFSWAFEGRRPSEQAGRPVLLGLFTDVRRDPVPWPVVVDLLSIAEAVLGSNRSGEFLDIGPHQVAYGSLVQIDRILQSWTHLRRIAVIGRAQLLNCSHFAIEVLRDVNSLKLRPVVAAFAGTVRTVRGVLIGFRDSVPG